MSGAFAYREPCQLCLASEVAQLADRGGNANRNYLEWGGTPIALAAEHRLPTPCGLPCPSVHRPVASFEGVPSLFRHRSITPPVPGVRALDTAWS
jgi:hypothetical protein